MSAAGHSGQARVEQLRLLDFDRPAVPATARDPGSCSYRCVLDGVPGLSGTPDLIGSPARLPLPGKALGDFRSSDCRRSAPGRGVLCGIRLPAREVDAPQGVLVVDSLHLSVDLRQELLQYPAGAGTSRG